MVPLEILEKNDDFEGGSDSKHSFLIQSDQLGKGRIPRIATSIPSEGNLLGRQAIGCVE